MAKLSRTDSLIRFTDTLSAGTPTATFQRLELRDKSGGPTQ